MAAVFAPVAWLAAAVLASPAAADTLLDLAGDAAVPHPVWAVPIGQTDIAEDEIDGISVDPEGNTIVSGVFRDRLDLAGRRFDSRGLGDVFVASFAPDGGLRWVRQIGGTGDDNSFDLTTDAAGSILISGWFAGRVDFGGRTIASRGSQDMFVAKLDPAGRLLWVRRFGGARGDGGNEIAVTDNGELAVSGMSEGGFEAGGRTVPAGGGSRDAFVLRLSADGDLRWMHAFAGPGTERIRAIAINEAGEVFVGFQYRGRIRHGERTLQSRGGWDGAAAKLSADGRPLWLLPVGGAGTDNVRGIGAAPDGSVYLSGVFRGPARLVDRDQPALGRKGDDFVLRVSAEGRPLWTATFAGPGIGIGAEMQTDARGVVVSALLDGPLTLRLGSRVSVELAPASRLPTAYLVALDASGQPRFAYMPTPVGPGAGAFGDVISVSRDGRYLAQALRFSGSLEAAGARMTTPGRKDSAIVLLRLNGA